MDRAHAGGTIGRGAFDHLTAGEKGKGRRRRRHRLFFVASVKYLTFTSELAMEGISEPGSFTW